LDYFCGSFDHVGAGVGNLVHDGWIYSYPVGHCPGDASDQSLSGTKSLGAISIANLVTADSEQRLGKTLLQLARTLGKKGQQSTSHRTKDIA
jgi:hypothetical protein